jgi:hypothetical protein
MRTHLLKSWGRRIAGTALLFSCTVGVGTSFVLLVSSSAGYLPYSDRPGPGWWGRVHWPSWAEFATYFGFAPWFAYSCLYFGLGIFVLSLVLGFASTPRWLNRLVGGLIAALAAGLAVLSAGWYLALAEIGPDAAIVIGLLYGLFLFPRFIQPKVKPVSMWLRISAVVCTSVLFLCWIVSPLLPRKPVPSLNFDLVRVTAGDKPVAAASDQGEKISRELSALGLYGQTHSGVEGAMGTGQNIPPIDVELVALEPITKEAKLAIPAAGYVVYVLKDGVWTAHPSFSRKDGRTFTIKPGTDAKFDGAQLKFGDEPEFEVFPWEPLIPKGQ